LELKMLFFSKPGLNQLFKFKSLKISFSQNKGFTLVEVLISAVILAVGLVVIFEVFLTSLDIVSLFDNRMNAQMYLDEKIWQLQSSLDQQSGLFIPSKQSGKVVLGQKEFNWQLDLELVDLTQELFKVNGQMNWTEGKKNRSSKRQTVVKSYFSNANPWKDEDKQ